MKLSSEAVEGRDKEKERQKTRITDWFIMLAIVILLFAMVWGQVDMSNSKAIASLTLENPLVIFFTTWGILTIVMTIIVVIYRHFR